MDVVIVYMSLKTTAWSSTESDQLMNNTIQSPRILLQKKKKATIMSDFNCEEVNQEDLVWGGGGGSWCQKLHFAMENQLIDEEKHEDEMTRKTIKTGSGIYQNVK